MARQYEWYREVTLKACGVDLPDDPVARRRLLATAGLVLAAVDGLALQVALDPAAVDDGHAFDLLKPAVQRALARDGGPGGAAETPIR